MNGMKAEKAVVPSSETKFRFSMFFIILDLPVVFYPIFTKCLNLVKAICMKAEKKIISYIKGGKKE